MDLIKIQELLQSQNRLPLEIRENKKVAEEFLNIVDKYKFNYINKYIDILRNWCYGNILEYSRVYKIEYKGVKETVDLEINDRHSYTANGIIAHNTINLPENVKPEIISDIYFEAWKNKLKGLTIYREGSRDGVLISNKDKKEEIDITKRNGRIVHVQAPLRPKSLSCDIYHITAKGEKWVVIIGILEDAPYEVFAFKKKSFSLSPKFEKGILTKVKSNTYALEIPDVMVIDNVLDLFEKDEEEALTRLISLSLRHGAEIKFVYEQLNKSMGDISSFSKAIARALKRYIKDGTKIKEKCSECGQNSLQYENGCVICKQCGNSKC